MSSIIKPFAATYYNPAIIKKLSQVVCPPYDIIDRDEFLSLKKESPYNFCRVLLAEDNNYRKLGVRFNRWLKKRIFVQDEQENLYLYQQKFKFNAQIYERFGILSLLRMNKREFVFPHEHTLSQAKEDRKRVIAEVKANLSPIFAVVPRPLKTFSQIYRRYCNGKPFLQFQDSQGSGNYVWKINDKREISKICKEIEKYKLVIADGHHRFEVAGEYYKKNKTRFKDLNYILAFITDSRDGLLILPTHRVVEIKEERDSFFKKLGEYFYIEETNENELAEKFKEEHKFCLGIHREKRFYFLRLKNLSILDKIFICSGYSKNFLKVYKQLDTYLFHQFILPLFKTEKAISYTHSIKEAKRMTLQKKVAFLLKPVSLDTVFKVASKGYRIPQKSTYFYPKVFSGILTRKFTPLKKATGGAYRSPH